MSSALDLPKISVIIVTKNEAARIERCLKALEGFDDIWVVDSGSTDGTPAIAKQAGAHVVDFQWDGCYPKKRQWCLDTLTLAHDFVFFPDADEIVPPALIREMKALDLTKAGYFIKGRYVFAGKTLRYGLQNNKLALLDRRKMAFPVVDDLDASGMGEIEGHYQPILKPGYKSEEIGQLQTPLLHEAYEDEAGWQARHERYARWEQAMSRKNAWPQDPDPKRERLKRFFRTVPFRPLIAFIHCYVLKLGFLDGQAGFCFACSRFRYYRMIRRL